MTINNSMGSVTGMTSKSVTPTQTTTYTLTATNASGSSTANATVTVTAKPGGTPDTQPPTSPALVAVIAKSSTEVNLTWTASTDNVGVTGYQVFRNGALLTSVSGATLTYADLGVAGGTTYTYAVKAFDAAGNISAASNSVQVTAPAALSRRPAPRRGMASSRAVITPTLP